MGARAPGKEEQSRAENPSYGDPLSGRIYLRLLGNVQSRSRSVTKVNAVEAYLQCCRRSPTKPERLKSGSICGKPCQVEAFARRPSPAPKSRAKPRDLRVRINLWKSLSSPQQFRLRCSFGGHNKVPKHGTIP